MQTRLSAHFSLADLLKKKVGVDVVSGGELIRR